MRIALFVETYLPYLNGVVTHVKVLKEGLERQGHKVLVVTADPKVKRHVIENGVLRCPAKPIKRFYNYGISSPISTERLMILKKFRPDIIHIHQEFGICFSGLRIAKRLNVPLVYTLHTMYDDYVYYIAPKPFIPIARKSAHRYVRYLAGRADALISPSEKVRKFFKDCGVKKPADLIPNAAEIEIFNRDNVTKDEILEFRQKNGFKPDDFIAAFCGRLGKEKSVDVLINYYAKTVKPEDKIKLLIIGEGPARQELMAQARRLGLSGSIVFSGKVEHHDMPIYYISSDAYVTASLSENYSISMLEAMASGLPVIHVFDPLNKGQVTEGVNGFVYHTADELYGYLKKCRDMPPEERDAFRRGVRNSVGHLGADGNAKSVFEVYQKAIERHKDRMMQYKRYVG